MKSPAGEKPAVLFVDRDGTLLAEPADEQIDSLEKVRFLPDVFASLQTLVARGFRLVMVSNQDGLGTASFPQADFEGPQRFLLETFRSQGIVFDDVLICPHFAADECACRKPKTALVDAFLERTAIDRARSAVIGDRASDQKLAENLGVRSVTVRVSDDPDESWPAAVRLLTARRATVERVTKETAITVSVDLDAEGPIQAQTGLGFFDHMLEQLAKHGGFSMVLRCTGDLHIDEHHTVEDCALAVGEALRKALGDKRGIARFGFLLPMDEAEAEARVSLDLSGRPYAKFEGQFGREQVGQLPTELVPHFFRSLAESLGAALHVQVRGENTHHMIEASFKAVGRALRDAFRREGTALPTTKGML
jgi:imidazoleglycerol-phosphate dehydratase / histidinol-phosphatase